jgi:pimeloyl-ACP methyl ester carboxylesterase
MSASSAPPSTPEGPGSVSGAPNLPAGFTDTFTSRYVDTGQLRLPAVIGREESGGEGIANTMRLVADDVQGVVLAGSGHWVAEQAPEQLLAALTAFLAPYRAGVSA